MNLNELLDNFSEETLGTQVYRIKLATHLPELTIEVTFTKSGNSIYAENEDLGICAGSQDLNEQTAKIKALVRMLRQLEIRLSAAKRTGNIDSIFSKEVSPEFRIMFVNFLEIMPTPEEIDQGKIPVYNEMSSELTGNSQHFFYKRISDVSDVSSIQESLHEYFNCYPLFPRKTN